MTDFSWCEEHTNDPDEHGAPDGWLQEKRFKVWMGTTFDWRNIKEALRHPLRWRLNIDPIFSYTKWWNPFGMQKRYIVCFNHMMQSNYGLYATKTNIDCNVYVPDRLTFGKRTPEICIEFGDLQWTCDACGKGVDENDVCTEGCSRVEERLCP